MPLSKSRRTPRYAPKHRTVRERTLAQQAQRTVVRNAAVLSTAAVAATGVVVAGGVVNGDDVTAATMSSSVDDATTEPLTRAELDEGRDLLSRSDSRDRKDEVKEASLDQSQGGAVTGSENLDASDPRDIARALLPEYGFSADQFSCLDALYVSESNWRVDADNPSSSAYGIPQALTETHDMPAGYFTSAEVQIRWGLDYIQDSYGSPCSAWEFKQSNNWY
ncbi:hypothetical protein GCM10009623_09720 [Nocardioides aestuarii]|uniref:Lytic transglycosylase domain-containing protein n=1 Tax=Nocardioides aestuarii TaxID=252231 RepID=A0ABW4THK9_9ACTN